MALNFRVSAKETGKQSKVLRLFGDFDASSACELIDTLDQSVKTSSKVAIDTDGLKTINSFGLNLFLSRMSKLKNTRITIKVTGRFSEKFKEE